MPNIRLSKDEKVSHTCITKSKPKVSGGLWMDMSMCTVGHPQRDALAFAFKPARRDQVLPQDLLFLSLKLGVGEDS